MNARSGTIVWIADLNGRRTGGEEGLMRFVPVALLLSAIPAAGEASNAQTRQIASEPRPANTYLYRGTIVPTSAFARRSSSPFIASIAVAPNAAIGLGKFVTPPRRRVAIHDEPITLQSKKVRRAAIGLSLQF